MRYIDFQSRALAEGKRYGADKLIFIREFAQNARDAGATEIQINTWTNDNRIHISFADNGAGMSFRYAKRYLFTLYASSKEKQTFNVGQFGVGFWSVLLFEPTQVVIDSNSNDGGFRATFNSNEMNEVVQASQQSGHGTTIVVEKKLDDGVHTALTDIQSSIDRYCQYLRQNDNRFAPVRVLYNGQRVDQTIALNSPCWIRFKSKYVEGAVGLDHHPSVSLYAGGIPVWQGTSLEELKATGTGHPPLVTPVGLSPVYIINGSRLNVTLDRKSVYDDVHLRHARILARGQMQKLLHTYLENLAPRSPGARVRLALKLLVQRLRDAIELRPKLFSALLSFGLVMGLAFGALSWQWMPDPNSTASSPEATKQPPPQNGLQPIVTMPSYSGARTDIGTRTRQPVIWYNNDVLVYFKVQAVSQLDTRHGMYETGHKPGQPLPQVHCSADCLTVKSAITPNEGGAYLAVPMGHGIDSADFAKRYPDQQLEWTIDGEWRVRSDATAPVLLSYRTKKIRQRQTDLTRWTALPRAVTFKMYRRSLRQWQQLATVRAKVDAVVNSVESSFLYDDSEATFLLYDDFFSDQNKNGNWFSFAHKLKRGDCDVKNVVAIYLLRRLGIPARLAVGYVGANQMAFDTRHAYIEYYDTDWQLADATGGPTTNHSPSPAPTLHQQQSNAPAHLFASTATKKSSTSQLPPIKENLPSWLSDDDALFIALIIFATGIFAFIALSALFIVTRKPPAMEFRHDTDLFARLLLGASENPTLFGNNNELFRQKLLPTVTGAQISFITAKNMAQRGALFYTRKNDGPVRDLPNTIDATSDAMFDLIWQLEGAIDADALLRLNPQPKSNAVITRMDEMFTRLGLPPHTLVECPGLEVGWITDIDTHRLPAHLFENLPPQFVAVCPARNKKWDTLEQAAMTSDIALLQLMLSATGRSEILGTRKKALSSLKEKMT